MSAAPVSSESYPENLPIEDGESNWHDLADYNAQILSDSKRLFVEHEDEIAVKVFDYGAQGAYSWRYDFLIPIFMLTLALADREKIFKDEGSFSSYLNVNLRAYL